MTKLAMKRYGYFLFLACVMLLSADVSAEATVDKPAAPALSSSDDFPEAEKVARLIRQLGDRQYVVRRAAEQQLLAMGMRTFDQIDQATRDPDPEIAANCKYLISELTVRWTRSDDPPWVRNLMDSYASLSEEQRLMVVDALGRRAGRVEVLPPLCRICRFDPSLKLSRQAATALLQADVYQHEVFRSERQAEAKRLLLAEVGPSVRVAASWLRLFALQLESPEVALPAWDEVIDQASRTAKVTSDDEMYSSQVQALLRNRARLELRSGHDNQFVDSVEEILSQPETSAPVELERFFDWAYQAEMPEVTQSLIERFRDKLEGTKAGLYLLAIASAKQGLDTEAAELAGQAFEAPIGIAHENTATQRYEIGVKILGEGFVEWSRNELRSAIEEANPGSETHSKASWVLADSLHDWQLDSEASEVLTKFSDTVKGSVQLQRQFKNNQRQNRLRPLTVVDSYAAYYRACRLREEGNLEDAWANLEQALSLDKTNADILISMYRVSENNPERRRLSMERIEARCRSLEQQIDGTPMSSDYRAAQYRNEWAWLVSNTEGDYDKAVRYSLKSIEILYRIPENERTNGAGLIDTLGRCYYAAGKLEEAVEQQRKAVELSPHLRVLQRQLEQFERELAEQS